MKQKSLLLLALGLAFAMSTVGWSQNFTLSPSKTPEQVRDEVRAWRRQSSPDNAATPAVVVVESGEYFLPQPLELTADDSNVVWKATPNAQPTFTRGRKIVGWSVNEKGWFVTKLNESELNERRYETLFVNGQRAVRARTPNENAPDGSRYFYVSESGEEQPNRSFYPKAQQAELFKEIGALSDPTDVQIRFYHSWETSFHRVKSVNEETGLVELTGDAPWSLSQWGANLRYHVEGVESALDAPGEFLIKPDGTILYIPLPGQTLENTTFIATDGQRDKRQTGLVHITGAPEKKAENVVFSGIHFEYDAFALPDDGLSSAQAAVNSPASIEVNFARGVRFENCVVSHTGGYAVWFYRGCENCSVVKCLLEDLGAGGVRIGAGWNDDLSEPNETRNCSVHNCIIRGYGKIDCGAIGVWIGHSPCNSVTHNDISDGFYTGVSVGWIWGYAPSKAHDNHIEFNHIHHIGKGVLSDMGGVYSLGISPGTTVSNNRIHDVYSYNRYGRGGWGLYTDEGSSNIVMENNLVYRVHTGTFHQHYGENNVVRNNILAFSKENQLQRSRPEEHRSFTFERNIVVYDSTDEPAYLLMGAWKNPWSDLDYNVYWNYDVKTGVTFQNDNLEQWRKYGKDAHSIIADPHFRDPKNGDFRFTDESKPVLDAIGFKPFDYTQAGVLKDDPNWVREAERYVYPEVVLTPDPPEEPFEFSDDFQSARRNPIRRASYVGSPNGFKIAQENDNRFLRIQDNNSYHHTFDPHFLYNVNYRQPCVTTVEFDVRVGKDGFLLAEWRDRESPYRIGPSLRIRENLIEFSGQTCAVQPGAWTHIKVVCPVGVQNSENRTWTISVQSGNDPEKTFTVPGLDPNWKTFDRLVFAALSTAETTIDLDNIAVRKTE